MKHADNQHHSHANPRLLHALSYAVIRSCELDLGMKRNSLSINNFKHASLAGQINPPTGGGKISYSPNTACEVQRTDRKSQKSRLADDMEGVEAE